MIKNRLHIILLFSMGMVCLSFLIPQDSPIGIKVMTYNIWNGFDWGKDTTRKENWIKWMRDKDPDVLALQELCGFDETQLAADAAKWGHNYVKILKTEGYPVGLTSKKPITLKERVIDELWHGLLHCETYGIDFFVVHLSPADCDFRFREAEIITQKVIDSKSNKYVILGDFNAHSPFDAESMKNNQMLLNKYRAGVTEKHSNLRLGEFDYSVISKFLSIPAIDVSIPYINISSRFTFPTPVLIGSYRKDMEGVRQTRERIDYILTSPILAKSCTGVTIYNHGEADTFSDHYPLSAEFSF
ncbi:MAG: endonuclease/exonuclease/phosphatase family protein [Bacteroidota bacterium]